MSAISTTLLEFLNPGDLLLYTMPIYGGTDHFITKILPKYGIQTLGVTPDETEEEIEKKITEHPNGKSLSFIYLETPANPTNRLVDIEMFRRIADSHNTEENIYIAVDNTYMGPLWQHPLKHGADLVIYSATKYIGGHSDVIAGACLANKELIGRVKTFRTFLGCMAGPWTGWLLMRSLETLKVRMDKQAQNASKIAEFLNNHDKVEQVYYLGNLSEKDGRQFDIQQRQCSCNGAMISFDIKGGEKEAFKFLDSMKLIKLAVSLGGTESLAEHPATMTHADVSEGLKVKMNITSKMIRLSVGVENHNDLIWDINQSLDKV